jgi:hypothetical protein
MKSKLVKFCVGVVAQCLTFGGMTQAASLWIEARIPRDGEFATIDGTRLHYRDVGTGSPIVLIHGLSGQMRNFAPDLVARLAENHRVILLDRPRAGNSAPLACGTNTLAGQADVIAGLIGQLNLDAPLIVGHPPAQHEVHLWPVIGASAAKAHFVPRCVNSCTMRRKSVGRHFHLGHSTNTVAANYGSGYALEVMREHMVRVWEWQTSKIFFHPTKPEHSTPSCVPGPITSRRWLQKHPVIFPMMASGIGMQLFRKESDILVEVLEALRSQAIVALPVHDAVIVMEEHKQTTITIMKKVFKDHTGITPQVTLG